LKFGDGRRHVLENLGVVFALKDVVEPEIVFAIVAKQVGAGSRRLGHVVSSFFSQTIFSLNVPSPPLPAEK
jgi:hypothetical protein